IGLSFNDKRNMLIHSTFTLSSTTAEPEDDGQASAVLSHKQNKVSAVSVTCSLQQEHWKNAIQKARARPDPWAEFHLEEKETEPCVRYRYNAVRGEWAQDEVHIKWLHSRLGKAPCESASEREYKVYPHDVQKQSGLFT
ncbi:hypothetical protein WMY93_034216, partial [Mugilogobius chulae]